MLKYYLKHQPQVGVSKPILTAVTIACVLFVTGCASNRISSGTESLKSKTEPAIKTAIAQNGLTITPNTVGTATNADARAVSVANQPVAKRSTGAWYGQRTIPVLSDAVLPQIFKEEGFKIDFDGYSGGRVPLAVVVERLTRMSSVPVRLSQDVYNNSKNSNSNTTSLIPASVSQGNVLPPMPSPVAGQKASSTVMPVGLPAQIQNASSVSTTTDLAAVSMKWNGSLERYLDHITGMLNLSWSYRDGVVVIERYVTESFEIEALGGTQDYKMSMGGSGGGNATGFGSSSESLEVTESGKSTPLDSLRNSIESLVKPTGGTVTMNESSGRMIVSTSKDVLSRVREIIRTEVSIMRRQAVIQIDVYSVVSNADDSYGLDWTGFVNDLAGTWASTITGPASLVSQGAAGLGYTLLKEVPDASTQLVKNTAARYGGSKVLIQALHQMGDSAKYRPISLVAKNRQWARKTNLVTTGYLSETTPGTSTATGPGSPGIKAGTVTTGDKFLVQPSIMDDGTIDLKIGMSMTDLIGMFTASSGGQTIQTPEVSGTGDQGAIRLRAGESMVITGLSKQISKSDRNGLAEEIPIALGGSVKRGVKREHYLVVVRATPI